MKRMMLKKRFPLKAATTIFLTLQEKNNDQSLTKHFRAIFFRNANQKINI